MITQNELNINNESYTNKDFYQIYPELIELTKQLTNRWDPQYSNESDPGLVLIKLLAFIGDKLNYNIDKNILECFLPSATQEESMRRLCDMLGYNMKYHQSATAQVSFMALTDKLYSENDLQAGQTQLILKPFETVITDETGDIIYTLIEQVILHNKYETVTAAAMEGSYVEVEMNDDNIVRYNNIDDNNRFYLPEITIAENGIWIRDAINESIKWKKSENLNTELAGSYVWKFGYDSALGRPYIQFPDDVVKLIKNGIKIGYIRTSGASGNISAKTLSKLQNTVLNVYDSIGNFIYDNGQEVTITVDQNSLIIQNSSAVVNGQDKETLNEAYNNFKKTIGTFDTLISCRDYANAIYRLVKNEVTDNTPLVSNIQVSDITNDINKCTKIAVFDSYGISYVDRPRRKLEKITTPVYKGSSTTAETSEYYTLKDEITNFDIFLYPLNPIKNYDSLTEYQKSFMPNTNNLYEIKNQINDLKTISHNISQPISNEDIYLIKNYYNLSAKIITTHKVNTFEIMEIKNNIHRALFENFNARKLEYGEEIPYNELDRVILNSDARIKVVNLNEPELETYYMLASEQGGLQEGKLTYKDNFNDDKTLSKGQKLYLKLAAKNILAGRLPLFNFNKDVNVTYNSKLGTDNRIYGKKSSYYDGKVDIKNNEDEFSITAISSNLIIPESTTSDNNKYKLRENEIIQLISPKLTTNITYPVNVNYHFDWATGKDKSTQEAVPANMLEISFDWIYRGDLTNESPDGEVCIYKKNDLFEYDETNQRYITDAEGNKLKVNKKGDLLTEYLASTKNTLPDYVLTEEELTNNKDLRAWVEYKVALNLLQNGKFIGGKSSTNEGYSIYGRTNSSITASPGELVDGHQRTYIEVGSRGTTGFKKEVRAPYFFIPVNNYNFIVEKKRTYFNAFNIDKVTTQKILFDNSVNDKGICLPWDTFNTITIQEFQQKANVLDSFGTTSWVQRHTTVTKKKDSNGEDTETTDYIDEFIVTYNIYNKGKDYIPNKIIAGTEYALHGDDALYINYTEEDGNTINIKYTADQIIKNGIVIENFEGTNKLNIIKPNFDLIDSVKFNKANKGIAFSKTTGLEYFEGLTGMLGLKTNEQIEIRQFASTRIDKVSYVYWITNNNNKLTFTKTTNNKATNSYSYILEDGEYFFYTNSAKTYLLTYGSGTRLTLTEDSTADIKEWTLPKINLDINLDNISSNGIGAFAETDWVVQHLTDNKYLTVEQMNIITLTEGTEIENLTVKDSDKIDSKKWYDLENNNANKFKYDGKKLDMPSGNSKLLDIYKWQIRAILNLNFGPNKYQKLYGDDSQQEITLYTSMYKDSDGTIIPSNRVAEYLSTGGKNLIEVIDKTTPLKTFSAKDASTTTYIKSNYIVERLGGQFLSTHRLSLDGQQTDDLKIYDYIHAAPTYQLSKSDETLFELSLNTYRNKFTKLSSANIYGINLPVYIPKDNFALISIYYAQGIFSNKITAVNKVKTNIFEIIFEDGRRTKIQTGIAENKRLTMIEIGDNRYLNKIEITSTATATISFADGRKEQITFTKDKNEEIILQSIKTSETGEAQTISISSDYPCLSMYGSGISATKSLTLKEGVNIVKVIGNNSNTIFNNLELFIDCSADFAGVITLMDIDLIDCSQNSEGIDCDLLGIPNSAIDALLKEIKDLDYNNEFFYNLDIDNSNYMDVKTLDDPYSWFNKNNIANRFVLPEINVKSLVDIEIAKSSKVVR